MTMAAASTLLLVSVYLYLHAQLREKCFLVWGAAVLATLLRYPAILWVMTNGAEPVPLIAGELLALSGGLLVAWGTRLFLRQQPRYGWHVLRALCGVAAAWIVVAAIVRVPSPYYFIPSSWLTAATYIWSGLLLWRSNRLPRPSNHLVGWAFVLLGLHNAEYPFLHQIVWFAPLGYLIPAVLRASIAVGTLMACLGAVSLQLRQSVP